VIQPGAWRFYAPDGRRLDTHHTPAAASRPLPTDPTVAPEAVTGHWTGQPLHISYATGILTEGVSDSAQARRLAARRGRGGAA
jgi:hypothetical protein